MVMVCDRVLRVGDCREMSRVGKKMLKTGVGG